MNTVVYVFCEYNLLFDIEWKLGSAVVSALASNVGGGSNPSQSIDGLPRRPAALWVHATLMVSGLIGDEGR